MAEKLLPDQKNLFLKLRAETYQWIEARAREHGRSRLREAAEILEAERAREARRVARGTLRAQGGAA